MTQALAPARKAGRRVSPAACGLLAALLLAAGLLPRAADARRLFVPQKHRTIQGAVDAASPGDTIWIKAGTYRGPIRITKSLVLFGEGGPDSTILDGGDSVRVVHIEGVDRGLLAGFTIRRGKAPGGGGIYCLRDSSVTITSCRFERNWEAGLAAWQCQGLAVTECRFLGNEGSGLDLNGTTSWVLNCEFIDNSAPSGGGIALQNSEVTGSIRKCRFERNRATAGTGGGIFADSSTFLMSTCEFVENTASVAGGAVSAMEASEVRITISTFRENRAASGGAIHADHSLINVALSTFDRNHVNAAGAAIQVVGRGIANVNPIFTDNTFYKNSCSGEGAAVFCQSVSPEIRMSIFVVADSVRALTAFDAVPALNCNLIYDASGLMTGSLPSPSTIVGDPRFCDPEKGDFRVRDLSPAYLALCGPLGAFKKPCRTFEVLPDH